MSVTLDDAKFDAIRRRDPAGDGQFFYAVRTTGVYCRPSCAARPARRENISVHASCADAERAGFRPCKRCRPNEPSQAVRHAQAVERSCRLIESSEMLPSLSALAAAAGLSPHYFHRLFKRITGVTPKSYGAAHQAQCIADGLRTAGTVTEAIYAAGYNASSRFYENSTARLGMTPTTYRKRGTGMRIRFALGPCSLGQVLVAATDKGICAILLGDDAEELLRELQDRFAAAELSGGDAAFDRYVAQVVGVVEAPGRTHDLPLDIGGTAFQQKVWQALRRIPAGTTVSYAGIAVSVGQPAAVRAVAGACAANALAVAIPCHRVVRTDGALSGYRWGVERKRELLAREADPTRANTILLPARPPREGRGEGNSQAGS